MNRPMPGPAAPAPAEDDPSVRHACDPLTAEEIIVAATAVRAGGGLDQGAWFETIALDEEDKDRLLAGEAGTRRAYVCCYEPSSNRTFAGLVDLAKGRLIRWDHVPEVQARIVIDEFAEGGRIAKADPAFREACRKRGIEDIDKVLVEPWAAGHFGLAGEDGERIGYGQCWLANEAGDNPYARPIANLHPVIDLRRRRVLRVDDFGVVPLPPDSGPIRLGKGLRTDLKPLEIRQPEGASFTVEGHLVKWQKWRFRVGFNVREGLILHDIGYQDGERLRPIMHRASLAEMVVPYGDPRRGSFRRNAFDVGEYGIGSLLDSLSLGCDCLGHIHYFDVTSHDWHGTPVAIRNAICLHEEDTGLLWKFGEWGKEDGAIRARSRRLAVSAFATIGNYVYGLFWYFHQDGTIGVEVKATGIPLPNGHEHAACSQWGGAMADRIEGSVHQHIFSFRFDMAVDGPRNAVREINFESVPVGPDNPHGNAIRTVTTALESEQAAQRNVNQEIGAAVENHQSQRQQQVRRAGRLQARAGGQCPAVPPSRRSGGAAGAIHVQALLGDAIRALGALSGRLVSQPAPGRGGHRQMDGGRPAAGKRKRGGVVHAQLPSPAAPRGLAGAAGGAGLLPLDAVGLLRPQPGPRRAAAGAAGLPLNSGLVERSSWPGLDQGLDPAILLRGTTACVSAAHCATL